MNKYSLTRTTDLLGEEAIYKLKTAKVLIAGLGGVGGFCLEALARSGVSSFVLIDADSFEESNLNRQLLCTDDNLNSLKTDAAEERVLEINPEAFVQKHPLFINESNIDCFLNDIDIVVDAIDSINSKCYLLKRCIEKNIPVVSSMGAALRTDPTLVRTSDISRTSSDPLAKAVRQNLRKDGIETGIQCVYSIEKPKEFNGKYLGSIVTVTGTFGLVLAQLAINQLTKKADS